VHWAEGPSRATCPTEMLHGDPIYKPEYQSENLEPYKAAFSSSWSDVRTSHNTLVALHKAYKGKEKDLIPILQVDPFRAVGAGVQGIDASKSFVGGMLKPSLTKIDSSKLSADLRAQISKAQGKITLAKLEIENKRSLATNANQGILLAFINVQVALNNIEIEKIDTKVENLLLDKEQVKRDLEDFKARVKAVAETAKLVTSFINTLSDPSKMLGNVLGTINQGAAYSSASAEAGHTAEANAKLAGLDSQIRSLKNSKGGLRLSNANVALASALIVLHTKVNEAKVALRGMDASKLAHDAAYREMGVLIEKAGAASGLNPKDRKAVAGAVEAVPKIEMIQQDLQNIDEGLRPPSYNEASGIGAAMASNLGVFAKALSTVKGNRAYVAELKTLWEARRASVMAVIERSVSFAGEE
jgi:hypothetical protein